MEMFLILMVVGLLTVAVSAVLLLASTRPPEPTPLSPEQLLKVPSRFFADDRVPRSPHAVPIEVLLLQIERHVRLEQAAAEAFRDTPTPETLWAATVSPLLH
jgi:hypothetical protein